MDYDSESSLENGRKKRDEDSPRQEGERRSSWRLVNAATGVTGQAKVPLGAAASKALSSQVMEYYQKYAQNSNLHQYFALPSSNYNATESSKYYYSIYELSPKYAPERQSCIGQDYNLKSYIPKERRRWIRPPLIGQSSSTEGSSIYVKSMTEQQSTNSDSHQDQDDEEQQQQQQRQQEQAQEHEQYPANTSSNDEGLVITEEKAVECSFQERHHQQDQHQQDQQQQPPSLSESTGDPRKAPSPTSSVASHKPPLEWDSGADVGYLYSSSKQLSTLERMALARGCSAALRLDPEGVTTEQQQQSPGAIRTSVAAAVLSLTSKANGSGNGLTKTLAGKPDANSTPLLLLGNVSGSESEVEITPIVKNHLPGIVAGDEVKSDQVASSKSRKDILECLQEAKDTIETPKSANVFKLPLALKFPQEESNQKSAAATPQSTPPPTATSASSKNDEKPVDEPTEISPLKKSSSMNLLASPTSKYPLKRSQSELNLCGNEKAAPKLIFNSTSSIATVVNNQKPMTCNKQIQTSFRICAQESVGVQVSVPKEEEKPPLPKRATSLVPRSLNSILKNPKSTYKVQNPKTPNTRDASTSKEEEQNENEKEEESSSDSSQNASLTPQADDTENNVTGRANSFEYFPGHIYENVPNGSTSQVSSVDTGRSNSTMPNTSSSIDEKLWGDSDNLVRDLERSVNILKSLVDANKLDKQVKKRLIHHVVKRLVTAKYTDDKIEHNLEENVPWNPADARNKVYRTEIIQALAKNTTDSSDDWKPSQKKKSPKKTVPTQEARAIKEIINIPAEIESSNSDKFDRNTDRTVMDGRKARMGLRADDCDRRCSSNTPTNKSESSECFLPQRAYNKNAKIKNMFITSTSNSSPQDQNRALLDAVVNSRPSPVDSSNEAGNSADWRLPATASERRYELRHCNESDSADAKLVSYAEMEKQNQLIWITNEISHLSNLKKLLEQTKTKPERSKSSPRKSKQSISKPQKSLPPTNHPRHQNGEVLVEDGQLSRQWSSHCNLANCPPPELNAVKRLKKRNSGTQTATEYSAVYSKTSSEIVSARIQSPNKKLANAYAQTPKSPLLASASVCPVHSNDQPMSCICGARVCQCCTLKNPPMQYLYSDGDRDEYQSEARSEDAKKTKNQLNATKLKCTCQINDQMSHKVNVKHKEDRPKKSATASKTCDNRQCQGPVCSCGRYKLPESPSCQCGRDCECENRNLVRGFGRMQINKPPTKKLFEKSTTTNCSCECKRVEETSSARTEYSHYSNKKGQPYFLGKSAREANTQNCCCGNKTKDRPKSYPSPQLSARTNDSASSDYKCCRVCGTIYQKDRSCNCVPKSYPKAVAYELAFVDDDQDLEEAGDSETGQCGKINMEIKSIEKNVPLPSSRSRGRVKLPNDSNGTRCACRGLQRTIKRCDCECREVEVNKFYNERKSTLQECLASNNPGFADNVETRRQYVSEIQRLRQLRKDRRMQLLAMATTTNVFTGPEQPKVTKSVQKKISDEEMRARLRKRYFQLTEVRAKRRQQQLQEEGRCNKLMAKIFGKKLQQKVLRGQVDLSQSVSVISNL
ncbi:ras guanine nucleotide exchange factor R isoform X1 [Nasonia vitripennis]|uniref:ALMS motif domain-containing protein n=1 Tax=Nasonia vitripennis TaxID=7425 RepID=A0A7M7QGG4_NASVI|nr:ras guanine nucleotide exchange factor R isoform X1 [Nasonia vitripennis]